MKRISRFLRASVLIVLFASCSASTDEMKTKVFFDLGYGKSDSSLDMSGGEKNTVGISLKRGIFHLLSRGEAKILRISSYGQTLAMWYDPEKGSAPLVLKDVQINDLSAGKELGRIAMQVAFNDPWPMTADSRQLLYVADNRFIRRFDSNGRELPSLGQEGIGGNMFPVITELDALENDDLAVLCASESETLVYFYDRNGVFLHVLKLNDQTMPVPSSILEKNPEGRGIRIIASLESISPTYSNGRPVVVLKINYYMEKYDPDSGVTLSIDPVGGWIVEIDAGTGTILDSFPLQSSVSDLGVDQQLIAARSSSILSIRWDAVGIGGEVFRYNQKGKVIGKLNFSVPDPGATLVAMTVGDDGYLYLLGQLPSTLRMYACKLPHM
jgi:hypothetical protein